MRAQDHPTVLVVEDEPLLRMHECDVAEGAGLHTLEAANADEALDKLEGPEEIEILLTDVHMPGTMDGLDLVAIVRRRWPDIKIVVASSHCTPEPDTVFLAKPFTPDQLVTSLLSVL